eukprot:Gb_35845 [translate_table: standard]
MPEAVQEISIYIHRFHNLDLFQQGWYQIKVDTRWEDSEGSASGIPTRVAQYDVPNSDSDVTMGVWQINDSDHSFGTQPFQIRYARQDVYLSVMVSFSLDVTVTERLLKSAVLIKFELLYAPIIGNSLTTQELLNFSPASIHEFRVPPKALLGLHSYCPLHFDTLHMVLVDVTIHIVLSKADSSTSSSDNHLSDNNQGGYDAVSNQAKNTGEPAVDAKDIALWKVLSASRDILLNELQNLGKAINRRIVDPENAEGTVVKSITRKHGDVHTPEAKEFVNNKLLEMERSDSEGSAYTWTGASEDTGAFGVVKEGYRPLVSKAEMLEAFQALGNQLSSIRSSFLKFHREHRIEILEYLRRVWAEDRSTEWSMWLVHSIKLQQNETTYGDAEEDSHYLHFAKEALPRKSNEDPAMVAASCAELHRRGIEQMKINNRFLQDLQLFGSSSQAPVIYVERHIIQGQVSSSVKDAFSLSFSGSLEKDGSATVPKAAKESLPPKMTNYRLAGRALRVVVFVHGFQGHHLDLRLVRNQWLLTDPGAECVMSTSNEDKTTGDFREMGQRLAEEVSSFLRIKLSSASRSVAYGSFRLSFVGHSIGNIIIRAALTDAAMKPYLNNLYTFLSISGPHLGYLYSSNTLFSSGLWLLKKLKGSPCMHQLTFTDETDIHSCFLFKLSQEKTFEHFQNIVLLSSPQDRYVPYHSARLKICQAATRDSKKGPAYRTMLKNCLDQILLSATVDRIFMHCDVNFDTSAEARSLNNFIGRTAHIEFLETCIYARFIMWSFPMIVS